MNVLGVFAHPDDEVLGAGGTLAKHAAAGDLVSLCYGTSDRLDERIRARSVLGASQRHVSCLALPDQEFETTPIASAIKFLSRLMLDPDIIYTHHPGDLNLDHAWLARAVLTAFRPKPSEKPRTILACEVLSSTEWTFPQQFQPNWFEALQPEHMERAKSAMECYTTELAEWPHPRSGIGMGNRWLYRGQQCGVHHAEAFQLLRRT